MSDVPVTAWWLLAIWLVARRDHTRALLSGLAASAAIITRPNLVLLVVPLGIWVLVRADGNRMSRLLWLALGAVPGCLVVARINSILYGSPLSSGYGSITAIYSVRYVWMNLARYPRWLVETETPLICVGLAAPWIFRCASRDTRRVAWLFLALSALLFACYLFYVRFDS